jgi:uncharacterized protein (DUF1499 family)
MPLLSFRGRPRYIGLTKGQLNSCPSSPNCVCSDDRKPGHGIDPMILLVDPGQAWPVVVRTVATCARTRIVSDSENYLHAEVTSGFFGFVDDLELHLRPADRIIAVRSASRLGYSDFGVNRARIEHLRVRLQEQKIVR